MDERQASQSEPPTVSDSTGSHGMSFGGERHSDFVEADVKERHSRDTTLILSSSVSGALLFFCGLLAIGRVGFNNMGSSNHAVNRISDQLRKEQVREVEVSFARILQQVWRKAQAFHTDQTTGSVQKDDVPVIPFAVDLLQDPEKWRSLSVHAFPTFDRHVWMVHGAEATAERRYISLAGFSLTLQFQASGEFIGDAEPCSYVGVFSALCLGAQEDPYQIHVQSVNSSGSLVHEVYSQSVNFWDDAPTLVGTRKVASCNTSYHQLGLNPQFAHFGWVLRSGGNGADDLLSGTSPVVTAQGVVVGEASFSFSVTARTDRRSGQRA